MALLREIDCQGERIEAPAIGVRPELMWLPLDRLRIDGDFQRPLEKSNWAHIRRIASAFTWAHFTPVVVARLQGGLFSVIDGQHRCHAARLVGMTEVPCIVSDLTDQQQARAFAQINSDVTAVSPYHLYRAALAACEPWAVTARKVVEDAGCRLATSKESFAARKPGVVHSIQLVRRAVETGQGRIVTKAFASLWDSPVAQDPKLWTDDILRVMIWVLNEHPRAQSRDLAPFMRAHCPDRTRRDCVILRNTDAYRNVSQVALMKKAMSARMNVWLQEQRP